MASVLMHQGIGLEAFNALPKRKAVHALYECANSVTLAGDLAQGRPYANHDALFRRADALLFSMSEPSIDLILDACTDVGRRPGSAKSRAEQCAVTDDDAAVMAEISDGARAYGVKFGFVFVMFVDGLCARDVLAGLTDRMHNDAETERKVLRNELGRINRSRLERMLGPEGGYQNW